MYEEARSTLAALDTQLISEPPGSPLAQILGHPSVTVCNRYLDVRLHAPRPPIEAVLDELRAIECSCPECPQAGEELW